MKITAATSRLACDLSWRHAGPSGPPWRVQVSEYTPVACRALSLVRLSGPGGWWGITRATYAKAEQITALVIAREQRRRAA